MWNWILSWFVRVPTVVEDAKPLVKEGQDIINNLAKIVDHIRTNNIIGLVGDANVMLQDVKEFVAELEVFVNKVRS